MYCPRCGRQPIADELRFCSYCGFRLGVVKASLADEQETSPPGSSTTRPSPAFPHQKDINLGVILMFASSLFATLMASRPGFGLGRNWGALLLAAAFSSILLFSRPIMKVIYRVLSWEEPMSRKGMGFGATLMFISTIMLAFTSLLMFGRVWTPTFFYGLIVAFALLLVISQYLMRTLRHVVTEDAGATGFPRSDVSPDHISGVAAIFNSGALPPVQEVPISVFDSPRITTAEMVSPSSVTEQTTGLLEKK
jgi:hypothetical protein